MRRDQFIVPLRLCGANRSAQQSGGKSGVVEPILVGEQRVWIGCSGYVYKHWHGIFYPKDLPESRWLSFYAQYFPTVELNNTHYVLPAASTFEGWREKSPPGFLFAVKASR